MRATFGRISLGLLLLACASVAAAQQIQYAEPVELSVSGHTAQFDAYGRRFSLTLTENDRLLRNLPAQRKLALSRYRVLRGELDGQPGSWVRLVESSAGVEGAIWDGHDLYAVTRYAEAAPYLTTPLQAAPGQTVVYRLSDARDVLPRDFCALGGVSASTDTKQTALQQYHALVTDLQGTTEGRANHQIEIAVVADSAFAAAEQPDPTAAMLARINIVEGIYSEQVGLLVLATDVSVASANADPFTSTVPTTLLEQVGSWRAATPAARARGIAHLMTGKNLDGTTAGIAYLGSACEVEHGVSLSERSYGTTISALVMAHELGHNFGASHDGEAGTACASTPTGMIMSPSITGYAKFSQCSIDVIRAKLDTLSCVTAADYPDVSLASSASSVAAEGGVPFTFAFTVRSSGTRQADNVAFDLGLSDTGLSLESASADGGSCSLSGAGANCSFGTLLPGETRTVTLSARGLVAANLSAHAHVSADDDPLATNDTRDVVIAVRSGVDAAIGVSTNARNLSLGASLEVYADLRSLRALPVRNAVLSVNLNQAVDSASMPGASCTANSYSVICNVGELAPGAVARLTVSARTTAAGPLLATASVSAPGDGDTTNNSGNATAWVQAERDVEITAGPGTVDMSVGGSYEIPFVVRSIGTQPTGDVAVWISMRSGAAAVDSLDAGGASCTADDDSWRCELGALAPGDSREVRLRVRGTGVANVDVEAMAEAADDGYNPNNSTGVRLRIDNTVDLGIALTSGGVGVEDAPIDGQVSVRSGGRDPARNAFLDIEIPAGGTLLRADVQEGADCELLDDQHARCALPAMARGAYAYIDYRVVYAEPGSYEAKFALSTPGDSATGNDSSSRTMLVRPYYDIGVSGDLDLTQFIVGGTRELTFEVSTARRALARARFVASNARPGVEVTAIRANAGDCQVLADSGGVCDFSDLPPDTRVLVTVTWSALAAAASQEVEVSVSTPGDVTVANDDVVGSAEVVGRTDVELRVETTSNGVSGQVMQFPPISLINGSEKAVGTRLEVTLPAGVALVSVSAANAICSGNEVLRCDFSELDANSTSTVNLTLRANAGGSYVSALKLSSLNDMNPANDTREVSLNISSHQPTSEVKTSGGGGGLEWLSLLLLAALGLRRCRSACSGTL